MNRILLSNNMQKKIKSNHILLFPKGHDSEKEKKQKSDTYLIREKNSLPRMIFLRLYPWVTREMDWTTSKTFNGDTLHEKLLLMLVDHCDCPRHTEIWVHCKFSSVMDPLSFKIWFLWPVSQRSWLAPPWFLAFYKNQLRSLLSYKYDLNKVCGYLRP